MADTPIPRRAALIYSECTQIAVEPRGDGGPGDMWDIFDGPGGALVDTVTADVLIYLDANYDQPVRLLDGSDWEPPRG